LDSAACAVFLGGDTFPLIAFLLDRDIYLFNVDSGTWMTSSFREFGTYQTVILGVLATENVYSSDDNFMQTALNMATQFPNTLPSVWSLIETVKDTQSISGIPDVLFPQEELLFGRDVTIDALYIAFEAALTRDLTVEFLIGGIHFSSVVFPHATYPTLSSVPIEMQVFPDALSNTTGVFTAHSPYLEYKISVTGAGLNIFRFDKITMYGSFDPSQRPV
jgi:hypothetical protein